MFDSSFTQLFCSSSLSTFAVQAISRLVSREKNSMTNLICSFLILLSISVIQVNLCEKLLFLHIVHWIISSVHENSKLRTISEHIANTNYFVLYFVLFWHSDQFVCTTCSDSVLILEFMYWTGNSIENLFSYCGLVDARISTSVKDLPVPIFQSWSFVRRQHNFY